MYEYIGILLGARPILHISRVKVKAVGSGGTGYLCKGKGKGKVLPRTGDEGPEGRVPV
jgi:hypothetical protein